MAFSIFDKWRDEFDLQRKIYHGWPHLFHVVMMLVPFSLWNLGFLERLADAVIGTFLASILYEIYCLRCDVKYYAELWRTGLK
jgi:hypothetical protein